MILNTYETIYIVKPNTTESQTSTIISKYKNFLETNGASNISIQHRGRRHLSYDIKNYYDGVYIQMNYNGNAVLIDSLRKLMRLDSNIFRYLILKQTPIL
uniref:30S ribosomal protein S6, chloroplastic n=1 Tax=Hildenbrandia rivularis TaxID=135206 RepID=A0A1C9CFR3_9FLOR|nr:ribosomal protein S6 [Hildenbrandia rivularis]AOM67205.1 ribosomal protein S6 [Hildenbrandia rivularis]